MNKNKYLSAPEYALSINENYINKPSAYLMAKNSLRWEKRDLPSQKFQSHLKKGHAFAPQFLNCRVIKSNFEASNYIALDIDNNMRLEEALANPLITDNCDFIYTTASHTEAQHKFRILFVTDSPWTSVDAYEGAIKRLMTKVGHVDEATKNANRIFFGSTKATFYKFHNKISPSLLEELNAPLPSRSTRPSQRIYLRDNIALKNAMFQIPDNITEDREDLIRLALFAEVNIAPGVGQALYQEKWHNGTNSRSDIQGAMRRWYEEHDAIVSLDRIKEILNNFGVDYTYSLYDTEFPRFTIHERFLSLRSIEKAIHGKKLVAIRSPMGTGKTTFLRKYLDDKEFDFVAHRVSLVNKLAKDFGAVSYRDMEYYQNTLGQDITRFVCTFHSYDRCRPRPKDVIVIDEVHQGLHTLANEDLLKGIRRSTFQFLCDQLRQSKQIIILDAHLMDEDVAAIAEMGDVDPQDILIIDNYYSPDRGACHFYETKTPLPLIETLKEDLSQGKRCYLSCVSKRTAKTTQILVEESFAVSEEEILEMIDTKKYKILMINSETTLDRRVIEFMQDPVTQSQYYNLVIATPSIGSGISLDGPLFDKVFHIGAGDIIPLTDQLQMPSRVRDCRERHMWIEARKPRSKLTDDCLIYNLIVENAIQAHSTNVEEVDGVKKLKRVDAAIAKIRAYHEAKNTVHQYNARDKAKQYLLTDGWDLSLVLEETSKLKPTFDKIKKFLTLDNRDKIFNARDLDSYDAVELEALKTTDPDSIYALLRFKIKDTLRVETLTLDDVHLYLTRHYAERLKFIETCTLDLTHLTRLDDDEVDLTEVDRSFYLFRKKLMNDLLGTVGRTVETILTDPVTVAETNLQAFAEYAARHSAVITQTLKLEVSHGFKPVKLFSRVLDKMGIRRHMKSLRAGDHTYKEYRTDASEMNAILQRRQEIPSSFESLLSKIKAPNKDHPLIELTETGRFKKMQKNL